MRERLGSWKVLEHSTDLRWYLAGNVCSNVGTWLQNTAQILLAYQMTRSVVGVGIVTAAQFASPLLLGPVAGTVADRFDRRRVLLVTQVTSAGIAGLMALFELTHRLTLHWLTFGAFCIGTAFAFTLPALSAFIPALVPESETKAAMALNGVSFNVGRALAPVLSVGVITTIGFAPAFGLNALSFVVLAVILVRLRPRRVERDPQRPRLLDGLRIARKQRRIGATLLVVALTTLATDPPLVLGPVLATEIFGVSATWAAYFLTAFGAGTLIGSFMPGRTPSLRNSARYLLLLGGAIAVLPFAQYIWIGIAAVVTAGAASLLAGATTQTLLLNLSGPQHAGRVMAVWSVAFAGSRSVATAADTWLAHAFDVDWAPALVLAAPAFLVAAAGLLLRRSSRGRQWVVENLLRESTPGISPNAIVQP